MSNAEELGACWGRGGHSWFPWRWVKKRQVYERACRHCRIVEVDEGEPPW